MRDVFASAAEDRGEPSYADLCAGFRWEVPETFNFGTDVVDRWARERDGPALIWSNEAGEERRLSYSDVAALTDRFANVLRSHGIAKGDRVLVMMPRRPEWMIAMVGAMKIGAVPIPCIEMLTARDVGYRVEHAEARAVVCRAEHVGKFDAVAEAVPVRVALGGASGWLDWEDEMAAASPTCEPERVAADDPAVMYYTSGSTGHPKAIVHAARAVFAWRGSAIYWLDLKPGDRMWCTADTGWSKAGTSILFGPWSCGACSVLYDGPFSATERLKLLERRQVTVFCAPGTELSRLVDEPIASYDLSHLRRTVTSGEALSPAIADRWQAATGVRIDEAYGLTECLMVSLNYPGEEVRYGSMGRPSPGVDLDVVSPSGERLAVGQEGDVALLTPHPQLMLAYWGEPDRLAASLREGPEGRWFLTGDRAERDGDGYLWYRGRSDDVISSAGYRIGPLEVENALLEHEAVQICAVVGSPDIERGEIVKAFVVLRQGFESSPALTKALQDHVKSVTAPYKYPRAIEYTSALPTTATGKIRRRDLRDREYEAAGKAAG
ncbi:acyl-CoA synthetase [Enterovirga rhinocerotis]|uniref:Acetyl-CoA synthetase n=1 Tax=Enterovirga rhinocerotis TaxID=1339210 RepID=A0A4V3DYT2_9HYPH|nr:AMP-binding protein [Enterovirga rhinocerotis]TDR93819.1 acetyl-CoA synthetase [Enterovirga rhinocerotis]